MLLEELLFYFCIVNPNGFPMLKNFVKIFHVLHICPLFERFFRLIQDLFFLPLPVQFWLNNSRVFHLTQNNYNQKVFILRTGSNTPLLAATPSSWKSWPNEVYPTSRSDRATKWRVLAVGSLRSRWFPPGFNTPQLAAWVGVSFLFLSHFLLFILISKNSLIANTEWFYCFHHK